MLKLPPCRFANQVLNPNKPAGEDRLAIVTLSNGWEAGAYGTQIEAPGWITDQTSADSDHQQPGRLHPILQMR